MMITSAGAFLPRPTAGEPGGRGRACRWVVTGPSPPAFSKVQVSSRAVPAHPPRPGRAGIRPGGDARGAAPDPRCTARPRRAARRASPGAPVPQLPGRRQPMASGQVHAPPPPASHYRPAPSRPAPRPVTPVPRGPVRHTGPPHRSRPRFAGARGDRRPGRGRPGRRAGAAQTPVPAVADLARPRHRNLLGDAATRSPHRARAHWRR